MVQMIDSPQTDRISPNLYTSGPLNETLDTWWSNRRNLTTKQEKLATGKTENPLCYLCFPTKTVANVLVKHIVTWERWAVFWVK